MAIVKLKNIKVMTQIGVYDFEQAKRQPLFITLKLHYDATEACAGDDIAKAVDYSLLEKSIVEYCESSNFALIETLCDRLLDIVLQNPLISKVKITIAKPEAVNFAENVFVSMKKNKNNTKKS